MLKLLVLITFITVITADPLRNAVGSNDRIVGGEPTTIDKVPYQISLRSYNSHNCGGSIISNQWIVTAGHCVGGSSSSYSVRAGSTSHKKGGSIYKVSKVIRHQKYGSDRYGHPLNDIALIKVTEPFVFNTTKIQPIGLFDQSEESPANALSVISGWGNTGYTYPELLQLVRVPIITKKDCYNDYSTTGGIPENQICAAFDEGGRDACQGDSGGPLAIDGRLAGIVSWGRGCALPGNPGVYTEVAGYRTWIKQNSGV